MKLLTNIFLICALAFGHFLQAQTPTFLSTFEDGTTDPEIGRAQLATSNNGKMYVVPNPYPDSKNSSGYVIKTIVPPGVATRAEYSITRHETYEKKYIYQWKRYHPEGMFTDVQVNLAKGFLVNQWKTWPCEAPPISNPAYEYFDTLICDGGGIFNDMDVEPDGTLRYRSRAMPNCHADFYELSEGEWHEFTLEVYWTSTDKGYYRIWLDNVLFGYSDNMKTLFDGFIENTCDIFLGTGLYGSWSKVGDETTDSIAVYIDDVTLYDADSGYTITEVCPECEVAPLVSTDSNIYKININASSEATDGFNNYITTWRKDSVTLNLSTTFGQNNGIDVYLWGDGSAHPNNTLADDYYPSSVINTSMYWQDKETREIKLKDLNPEKAYAVRVFSATTNQGEDHGVQIWTTEENRDIVYAADNLKEVAEVKDLFSDANGDLTVYVKAINDDNPRPYLNAIEISEYTIVIPVSNKQNRSDNLSLYPNPVSNKLFIKGETTPSNITIYSSDGRKVKYAENTNVLSTATLRKGLYIVVIEMQESFITRKVIKE